MLLLSSEISAKVKVQKSGKMKVNKEKAKVK